MITKKQLLFLYIKTKLSVGDIAKIHKCSHNKVIYWMNYYKIYRKTISEAVYIKHNPKGDPFIITKPLTKTEAILYGLGLGLYWGEGTKSNKSSIRLGNTDPKLIVKFIDFLETFTAFIEKNYVSVYRYLVTCLQIKQKSFGFKN